MLQRQEKDPGYPGTGINKFEPFKRVLKDGYMKVACVKDELFDNGDKFGDNRHAYTLEKRSNVSIVHYAAHVPKEDRKEMTRNICFEFCRTVPDMSFFGLKNGRECYCAPFYKMLPGDSSKCDALCEGDTTTTCGGKFKSNIFSMHMCASTGKDLAVASQQAKFVVSDLKTRINLAGKLSKSMQEAGAANQKIFGKVGDTAASDLMQRAKIFAGDLNDAANAAERITKKMDTDVKAAGELEDFTDPKQVTKAERLMEAMVDDAKTSAKLRVALGRVIALAKPQHEHLGAANQYYPIMYFVDKAFLSTMQTGGGEVLDKPLVGTSMDGCASACDDAFQKCVGFSYFGTSKPSLCFLFSKFKSATYYTGCKVPGMLLQKDVPTNSSTSSLLVGAARNAGRSASSSWLAKSNPGTVSIAKWSCKKVGQPLQALNKNGKTGIYRLNIDTGNYDELFIVKKKRGNWFKTINACSINPVDSILYCAMKFRGEKGGEFLVRIDSQKFAYVARMVKGQYSATFDSEGNYYSWGGKKLRKISKVQKLAGYADRGRVIDRRNNVIAKFQLGADMAAVTANLEGTGAKTYLMGIKGKTAHIVRVSGGPEKHWSLRSSGLDGDCKAWGSAWSFKTEIYFSCNKGKGVYQLDPGSISLKTMTAKFYKAGKSVTTNSNDGMNCMEGLSPFKPVLPPRYEPKWVKKNDEEVQKLEKKVVKKEEVKKEEVKKLEKKKDDVQKLVGGGGSRIVVRPKEEEKKVEKEEEEEEEKEEEKDDDEDEDDKDKEEKVNVKVVKKDEEDEEDVSSGQVYCMAKLSAFEGINLKPDPSGKCKICLKELSKADRCY